MGNVVEGGDHTTWQIPSYKKIRQRNLKGAKSAAMEKMMSKLLDIMFKVWGIRTFVFRVDVLV